MRVQGNINAVIIEIRDAPMAEVLSALAAAFKLRYRTTATLDGPVSGTYRGSPQQVLARLLDGYNYVVKKEAGPLEVLVLGRRGDRAIAAPRPQAPPAANAAGATSLARQWRTPLDAK